MKKVYSLSGPITVALKEIGLLEDPALKAISIFHPVSTKEFGGEFLPGGIFLSRENSMAMIGSHVFYDDSRELTKMLSSLSLKFIEIKTRGLVPTDVTRNISEILKKHTSGCEARIRSYQQKAEKTAEEVLKKVPADFKAVFFLGKIKNNRLPEMALVNDGIIKWLNEKKKLKTYPSELAYVSWSAKIMNSLPAATLRVGIIDSGAQIQRSIEKLPSGAINLAFPGALIPGLSQLEAWLYLCTNLN